MGKRGVSVHFHQAHEGIVPCAPLVLTESTQPTNTRRVPLKSETAVAPTQKPHEEPQSPSSESSSGYFSHSVSTATLFETSMTTNSDANLLLSEQATSQADLPAQSENQKISSSEILARLGPEVESSSCSAECEGNRAENVQQDPDTDVGKDCVSFPNPSINPEEPTAADDTEHFSSVDTKYSFSATETTAPSLTMMVSSPAPNQMSTPHSLQADTLQDLSPVQKPALALTNLKPEVKSVETQPKSIASNPFKIQRVRTSELKSFTGILADEGMSQDFDGGHEGETMPTELWPPIALNSAVAGALEADGGLSTVSTRDDDDDDRELSSEKLEIVSDSEEAAETIPEWLKDGEYVSVGTNKTGTIRYIGPTEFADGIWIGVELDVPAGK